MVKRPPVGAGYGLRGWIAQRVSAAFLIVAFVALFVALVVLRPDGFAEWRAFVLSGWVRVLLFCSVLAIVWHAYIGARDIIMDYIAADILRLAKTAAAVVYLLACLIWAAVILL
ncbi:MAG: succinate dehydrogenase, hydrophobic membrane anchor protein [Gammaproteobacteria bacterium]